MHTFFRDQRSEKSTFNSFIPNYIVKEYIRDFDRTAETTNNASELYNKMLGIYPNRLNRTTVWFSARAIKG
jgi:hypothetical protein